MTPSLSYARPNDRLTPIVTLCLVFLCGALAGAVVMSTLGHRMHHPVVRWVGNPNHDMSVSEWKTKLDLSDEQTRRLTSVLDDFSTYYDNVLADGNSRILQILNDSQKKKFEQMILEHKGK